MNFKELATAMSPQLHASLSRALELGKWPDGRRLDDTQREICMQAVILWEQRNLPEQERSGFIDRGPKAEGERCGADAPQPLRWSSGESPARDYKRE